MKNKVIIGTALRDNVTEYEKWRQQEAERAQREAVDAARQKVVSALSEYCIINGISDKGEIKKTLNNTVSMIIKEVLLSDESKSRCEEIQFKEIIENLYVKFKVRILRS